MMTPAKTWLALLVLAVVALASITEYRFKFLPPLTLLIPAGVCAVGPFLWHAITGVPFKEMPPRFYSHVMQPIFINSRKLALVFAAFILLLILLVVAHTRLSRLKFVSDSKVPIMVYRSQNGVATDLIGDVSKDHPLFKNECSGEHGYIGRGDGVSDVPLTITVPINWFSWEDIQINVPTYPILSVSLKKDVAWSNPSFSWITPHLADLEIDSELKLGLPKRIDALPARRASISFQCPSAVPIELSKVDVSIESKSKSNTWLFPYYGEPSYAYAGPIDGLALLDPHQDVVSPRWSSKALPLTSNERQEIDLNLWLVSETGWEFQIVFNVHCHDPINKRDDSVVRFGPFNLDFPNDWNTLVDSSRRLQIVYYRAVDQLAEELLKHNPSRQLTIYIADSEAEKYLTSRTLPKGITYILCDDATNQSLIKVLGENQEHTGRVRNCILFDGGKMLLQDAKSQEALSSGSLVSDKSQIESLQKILSHLDQQGRRLQ